MLNLREPPPGKSSSSSSPEDPREAEAVESVRRLLESRQPPGLARIRRFVLKPRPRLWSFGVGVWLWLVKIAEWFARFLRWLGRGSGRVVKALGLAGFTGRRMQNLGARVGRWGRNWSSAEGRLGRLGVRCVAFGQRLVKWGAAIATLTDGASDLTERAAGFLRDIMGDSAPSAERTPDGGGAGPDPTPPPAPRRKAPAASAPDAVPPGRPVASATRSGSRAPSESKPTPASRPRPAQEPRPALKPPPTRTRPAEGPPKRAPAPAPAAPPPLPEDIPAYLRIELGAIRQVSRPLPDDVRRLILQITEARGWTRPADLAAWLGFDTNYLSRRYLAPMTKAGQLERRYPRSRHPRQTYRAARVSVPDP